MDALSITQEAQERKPQSTGIYSPSRLFSDVKRAVDLPTYAGSLTPLRRYGESSLRGRCPLPDHDDKTPSFHVYPDGRWHCYGCERGGDVIDLYQVVQGFEKSYQAAGALAVEHGIDLGERTAGWHEAQARRVQIMDAAEQTRILSFRRRLFRLLVLPYLEEIEDDEERREEISLAWEEWQAGLGRLGR